MSEHAPATVIGAEGGVYTLLFDGGRQAEAKLRGRLKQERRGGSASGDKVVIGDRVETLEADDGGLTIETILPRRNTIVRRGMGHRAKVLAANVDRVFVVVAIEPLPRPETIDRLLVVAEANEVPAVLLLNKMDLPEAQEIAAPLVQRYRAIGYPVLEVSARRDVGIAALRALLCHGSSAFMGPSGVGKSTLLNVIEPGLQLRTGELSSKSRSGRHTTVSSRLILLGCGGAVADTPGFSDIGLWAMDPAELDRCYPEMRGLSEECRFSGCTHGAKEQDCAVRGAVSEGRIAPERYESYLVLRREAEEARER
jgi:ribosome biogenesis GTPase